MEKKRQMEVCVRMEPCKIGIAEAHNNRTRPCPDVNKALTIHNIYWGKETSSERWDKIKKEYEKATGQRLQKHASPIRELVATLMTTENQAEVFKVILETKFGMDVLSYAVHLDEGHYDLKTKKWEPNYHTHFIVDTTIWTHEKVVVPKRKKGKKLKDPETGKTIMVEKDRYACRRLYSSKDMAMLQTYAAEVTGFKRGVPSSRGHVENLKYRAERIQEDIDMLMAEREEVKRGIEELKTKQKEAQRGIEKRQQLFRDGSIFSFCLGSKLLSEGEELSEVAQSNEIRLSKDFYDAQENLRKEIEKEVTEDNRSSSEYMTKLIDTLTEYMVKLIRNFLMIIEAFKQRIESQKEKMSLANTTKGLILTKLNQPATEQAKKLSTQVNELASQVQALKEKNAQLENINRSQKRDLLCKEGSLQKLKQLEDENKELRSMRISEEERMKKGLYFMAKEISPQDLNWLGRIGLADVLGKGRWNQFEDDYKTMHQQGSSLGRVITLQK